MKIAVHITHYDQAGSQNTGALKMKKFDYLQKILKKYLAISKNTKIFIHTNNNRLISNNKRITYIYHDLSKETDHNRLTWKCRTLIKKQRTKFDIFIYSEDDILFTKKNLDYWLMHKNICNKAGYNIGFLLCEYNHTKKKFYVVSNKKKFKQYIYLDKIKFIINDVNPYYGFWIYDSTELEKFIKTKWWNFQWSGNNFNSFYGTAEMSAIGWHGKNMDRYYETVFPVKNDVISKGALLHHLPNNYIKKAYVYHEKKIPFCIYQFEKIVEKKLFQKPYSRLKKKINVFLLKVNFIFFRKVQRIYYKFKYLN